MRLIIDHQTRYHYADVVRRSTQYLRLTPHSTARQQILSWELELPGEATCTTDGYGNILHVMDRPRIADRDVRTRPDRQRRRRTARGRPRG